MKLGHIWLCIGIGVVLLLALTEKDSKPMHTSSPQVSPKVQPYVQPAIIADAMKPQPLPSYTPIYPGVGYSGSECTYDCSGHEAGYQWAEQKGIEEPDDCGGNSQSFIEGCRKYANEKKVENGEEPEE
jgi:hypothetical protein